MNSIVPEPVLRWQVSLKKYHNPRGGVGFAAPEQENLRPAPEFKRLPSANRDLGLFKFRGGAAVMQTQLRAVSVHHDITGWGQRANAWP